MKALDVPAAGIRMAYDLDPGATYGGHLRIGNTRTLTVEGASASNLAQSLECDVELRVLGTDAQRGGTLVQASFENIEIDWELPAGNPITPAEFTRDALARLQGMNVAFNVLPTGQITYMPVPPQELNDDLKALVDQVLRGLDDAFLVVPKHSVKDGEHWSEDEHRGHRGQPGRYVEARTTATVDGLFHNTSLDQDVVQLTVTGRRKETNTFAEGARVNESEESSVVLFSTDGYLAQIDAESRDYDPAGGMSFRKLRVQWKKLADGTPGGPPASQTQSITDPCDPDYVGEAECADTAPPDQRITDPCDPDYVGAETCAETPTEPTPEPAPAPQPAPPAPP